MAKRLRSGKENIFLIGDVNDQITGAKLPSNRQVLSVLFHNMREVKLNLAESAMIAVKECEIFWEKARIPTKPTHHSSKKLTDLYHRWKDLVKNKNRESNICRQRETEFESDLENLFDIAHEDALNLMKIEEDKMFLCNQRKKGRVGCMAGVDVKLPKTEEKIRQRKENEERFRTKTLSSTSLFYSKPLEDCEKEGDEDDLSPQQQKDTEEKFKLDLPDTRARKNFITPKLVAVLDRCQLSASDAVYVLEAVAEALGHNVDSLVINKTSIYRCRRALREKEALEMKTLFESNIPPFVTVHWDGKLLPALTHTGSKEERLPIVITYPKNSEERNTETVLPKSNRFTSEKLIAIPKLGDGTGQAQASAIYNALKSWNLTDKAQIACSDTTASNTGHLNGALVLLEQKLERDLLYFPCRHHIFELVLKNVFESQLPQVRFNSSFVESFFFFPSIFYFQQNFR